MKLRRPTSAYACTINPKLARRSDARCQASPLLTLPFLLVTSILLTWVDSFQTFVSACQKIPRHAPLHSQPNLNLASIRSLSRLGSVVCISSGARCRFEARHGNALERLGTEENHTVSGLELPRQSLGSPQRRRYTEYQRRKNDWENRYTSLESLKETFGYNSNRLWGDLDAASARRLYKTLLPHALLELVQLGVTPEDLAPLAYQARLAAKKYARYRCVWPATIMASLYDGVRTFKKYGKFQAQGMSYSQVWEKYEKAVLKDLEEDVRSDLWDTDIATRRICMKIVESSCRTNEGVDRWILPLDGHKTKEKKDLRVISQTLENNVQNLLQTPPNAKSHFHQKFQMLVAWIATLRKRIHIHNKE